MKRPIAISLSPNLENKDVLLASKMLFSPLQFFKGEGVRLLEQWFRQYFGVSYAVSFASGRGALVAILKSLTIGKGDEVVLQSFTCVAVPNAVIATGAMPVYVDITDSLTIDTEDLQKKITKKTKAIIVQHTFGIPADIKEIVRIGKKYKVSVIEDCAHGIGEIYEGKKLGSFGDAAFFSFGRDKAFSSVFGGMAITNNKALGLAIRQFQRQQGYPNSFWVVQQLLHPIAFFFILPLYNFASLGKVLLVILQRLHVLSFPVLQEEKEGKSVPVFIKKLPNALCNLALLQLKRLNECNQKREKIVNMYLRALQDPKYIMPYKKSFPLLRFPLLVEKRDELVAILKKNNVYIGKWYAEIIDPKGVDYKKIFYQRGSCPNAEYIATKIINLPTYPTMTEMDAQKVIFLIKQYA